MLATAGKLPRLELLCSLLIFSSCG
jgi:hypothetical protein